MYLRIERKKDNKEFSNWLLKIIKQELIINLDTRKLSIYEDYIKESNIFNLDEKTLNNLNLTNIIYRFIRTLRKDTFKHSYLYTFNTHIKYGSISYYDICKFINYGNSEIKGYPFIVNVLSNIQRNMKEYEHMYKVMYEI